MGREYGCGAGTMLALSILLTAATGAASCRRDGLAGAGESGEVSSQAVEDPARAARMAWWREARFGLFIHWGLYAVPAGEWGGRTDHGEWIRDTARIPLEQYEGLRARFNPVKFDARAWARLARAAGMRYIVVTSKHHDGFCLFDSAETDWDVMSTPFGRDILRELAAACRDEGLAVCWYYSIMDWHHPDYTPRRPWEAASRPEPPDAGAAMDRYVSYMRRQLRELLTNYGPIGVLWFDGQWEGTWTHERGADLDDYVRSIQPSIIVNNRVDKGGGAHGMTRGAEYRGDFGTPEQEIPPTGLPGVDWETCMTMNDHWGYNRHDTNYKSVADLLRKLADIASKGGNFLLNVGPTAEGEIPPQSVERLEGIGAWMAVNGESIHGTLAGPFPSLAWGRCTQRAAPGGGTRLYLHVFEWPPDGRLVVPGIFNDPRRAWMLADPSATGLAVEREGDSLVVALPPAAPDAVNSVVVLEVEGSPDVALPPVIEAETEIFVTRLAVRVSPGGGGRANIQMRFTLDGREPTSESPEARGPIMLERTATVRARAFRGRRAVSPVAERTFTKVAARPAVSPGSTTPGMNVEYFEGDWDRLPDFDAIEPVLTGKAAAFDLRPRRRDDRFAFLYYGYLTVPEDGVYRFWTNSDDGSRLYVGDVLVVDNDGLHSEREAAGSIALARGAHLLTVTMFEKTGGHRLEVWMAGPGRERTRLDPGSLAARP
jgi:alpha-L-fucosidase